MKYSLLPHAREKGYYSQLKEGIPLLNKGERVGSKVSMEDPKQVVIILNSRKSYRVIQKASNLLISSEGYF